MGSSFAAELLIPEIILRQIDPSARAVPRGPEVPPELLDFIQKGKKFLIAGHKEPDGDCVGSQLALASFLRRMGKETILCSAGPFKRPEIKSYEHFFTASLNETDRAGARAIVVDCSSLDRAGNLEPFLEGLPLAVIDHHEAWSAAGESGSAGKLFYVDKHAPSTTFLLVNLIEALGLEPAREEAELLFLGLCTDTGFFRHVDEEGAETFEIAARLIRAGANPKAAYTAINGGKSLDSRRLLGCVLSRAESFFDGKLIFSSEEYGETCRFGLEGRDSDNLYRLFQSVKGAEAIVIIRQETPDKCTVGFRSQDWLDVRSIAESFGGGGHKNAAGCGIAGTIAELKPKIIQAFGNVFL